MNSNLPMAGGPVGAPPMMNNMGGSQAENRVMLNTYIYEYFLSEGMEDCARALLESGHALNVVRKGGENGNAAADGDAMDTDSKDDLKQLPRPNVPESDNCFLYEWFTLFWDMLMAQRNKMNVSPNVSSYVNHTQQQSRLRQGQQQQDLLRAMRPDQNGAMFNGNPMMRNMQNGMPVKSLARTAMANNQNNPAAMHMLAQGKQPGQMQRDPSDMDGNRRPASPGSADNAPSPSKRPRLDPAAPFPQQPGMNGQRPHQGLPGNQVGNSPNNAATLQAQQMLLQSGINPQSLSAQQFANFQQQPPQAQQKSIQTYAQNLQQHHGQQMPNKPMGNATGPQAQGSPMLPQGPPDGSNIAAYYNSNELGAGPVMRPGPGGGPPGAAGGSNHALQDYQMQLMLLEQQNKKRLMMARQEQDSMGNLPRDGPPGGAPGAPAGPNGQPFQDTSPQGGRPGASPNPSEQMKRGTPQMNPAGIPSPLPEGAQSRGSPNPMGFMPNMPADPSMGGPHGFFKNMNGMDGNMVAAQMNGGMRPPSSHPGQQPFNGAQMTPQMMAAQRQQQQQAGQQPGAPGMPWQGQPNGNAMGPQGAQGQAQTPQQRSMPPPSAPGAAPNANGRNPTASPQTGNAAPPTPSAANKPAPKKKDTKKANSKAANSKKATPAQNAAATPAADASQDAEPATPATPITPVNPSFNKNGAQNAGAAAQPAANAPASAPQQPPAPAAPSDPNQMGGFQMQSDNLTNFDIGEFTNPLNSQDVLQDFDFDSFLHEDGDGAPFAFDASAFSMDGGANEITTDN